MLYRPQFARRLLARPPRMLQRRQGAGLMPIEESWCGPIGKAAD
jgi:hypothetical protein